MFILHYFSLGLVYLIHTHERSLFPARVVGVKIVYDHSNQWHHKEYMRRYGYLKGKIMDLKIHPSKTVEFLYLLSHQQFAAHFTNRTIFSGPSCSMADWHLTQVFFLLLKSNLSDNFLCYFKGNPIINLLTKRIKLNLPFELSYLNSNFALTLG